jgi:membrane protein implicated in regulation of membrane protease activity
MGAEPYLIWIVLGFILIIAELLTGSFFLLVMGIGAFAGAAIAWGGGSFFLQAFGACAVALLGTGIVLYLQPKRVATASDNLLDRGQPVELESWVDPASGLARVKHRGASWEARVLSDTRPSPGAMLYITGTEGQTLQVSLVPPPPSA